MDVVSRGCNILTISPTIMSQAPLPENVNNENFISYEINNFTCKHDIDNDYETTCTCKSDYCNDGRYPLPTPPKPHTLDHSYNMIVDEVKKSIRQLRSDIKRTLSEEIKKSLSCS